MNDTYVDVHIYLKLMEVLIAEYGDFKISDRMHNAIIEKLADICEMVRDAVRQE